MQGLIEYYTQLYQKIPLLNTFNDQSRYAKVSRYTTANHLKLITFADVDQDTISYVASFIRYYQNVVMYPLTFANRVLGFGFRSLKGRGFLILPTSPFTLYSSTPAINKFYNGENIRFNEVIILTEGLLDAEFFGLFHDLSFSYLKSKVDSYQIQVISLFTKRVMICPDNDKTGTSSIRSMVKDFRKYNIVPQFISLPGGYGDPGELLLACIDKKPNAEIVRALIEQEVNIFRKGSFVYGRL